MENKKAVISLIAGSCTLITVGGTVLLVTSLVDDNKDSSSNPQKPLDRGGNYEHYQLTNKFINNEFITSIVNKKLVNNKWVKTIDENKFQNFIKTNLRTIFKSISKFSSNADNYEININYQIQNNATNVAFDIDWNLPNSTYHYYDQLNISII